MDGGMRSQAVDMVNCHMQAFVHVKVALPLESFTPSPQPQEGQGCGMMSRFWTFKRGVKFPCRRGEGVVGLRGKPHLLQCSGTKQTVLDRRL